MEVKFLIKILTKVLKKFHVIFTIALRLGWFIDFKLKAWKKSKKKKR
jgi:hypothetical protein